MRTKEAAITASEIRESLDKLGATANHIADERNILLAALKRIVQKADIGLREDGGKWAIQTLEAIEEIAQQCLEKLQVQP